MDRSKERLDAIYRKTDGQCHICRIKLARKNYGVNGARGAWEIEHSTPRANGGTDHLNNLQPSCIRCNRQKQAGTTKAARAKNGYVSAPLSKEQKEGNAFAGAAAGAAVGIIFGLPGMVIGGAIGALIGSDHEPA